MTTQAITTSMGFEMQNLDEAIRFAEMMAKSALVPKALQKQPSDVLIVLLTGRELGLSPMASLRLVAVIDGKPVIESEAYVAIVRSKPDCERFECVETTGQQATFVAKRKGHNEQRLTWTLKQAAQAGLLGKDNWKKYPETMLRWRCAGALARLEFAHHFAGCYMPDEAEEIREKDITPPKTETPREGGVAALAATIANINTIVAAPPQEESRIDAVQPPSQKEPEGGGVAVADPPPPSHQAATAKPPPRPNEERKPGFFKKQNIGAMDAKALSDALEEVGAYLKTKPAPKGMEVAQKLLAELMGEQDARMSRSLNEPPEPGSAG